MIPTPPRVLLARDPIDLRKGIAGLAAICEVHLGEAPLDGTLFVFSSRDRRGIKMLVHVALHAPRERPVPLAEAGW